MDTRRTQRHPSLIVIPVAFLAVVLVLSGFVLRAARVDTDIANARLLLVVANIAYMDPEHPEPLTRYLQGMPDPVAFGALHRFAVLRLGESFTVFAMEDDKTGWRFDPATASFGSRPEPVAVFGEAVVA